MSAMYGKGREAFGGKLIDWVGDSIKAVLIDTGTYTPSIDVDQVLADIPAGARIATVALANKANVLGVFDADDALFTGVPGTSFEACVVYLDTGNPATSRLIAYIDDGGFPALVTNGSVSVPWSNGANRIFKL